MRRLVIKYLKAMFIFMCFYYRILVFALVGSNGAKFKLTVPESRMKSVRELKSYVLHEKKIPVECQTLFYCKNKTHLEPLKDGSPLPKINESSGTLHLYITKTAQKKSLEKTRQSDFEDWLKRLKATNTSTLYTGMYKLTTYLSIPMIRVFVCSFYVRVCFYVKISSCYFKIELILL